MAQVIPGFSNNDQLGLSFFASMVVHLVLILGVTFAIPKARELYGAQTLEITLVQVESERSPENPEFLAQSNQAGGGSSEQHERATNPLPVRELAETVHQIPAMRLPSRPKVVAAPAKTEPLTQKLAERAIPRPEPKPEKMEPQPSPENLGLVQRPSVEQERTRLVAEIDRVWHEYQSRPKHKYLNARTREYKYAAYMKAWEAKVERIGNLNYPEEARRRGLSGQLRLDVALNADGSINAIIVRRSSGHTVLDDAARRIVQLAAPFAPFPDNIREEIDVLHITRTWRFNDGALTQGN
jgi:periplasmic protein TonB